MNLYVFLLLLCHRRYTYNFFFVRFFTSGISTNPINYIHKVKFFSTSLSLSRSTWAAVIVIIHFLRFFSEMILNYFLFCVFWFLFILNFFYFFFILRLYSLIFAPHNTQRLCTGWRKKREKTEKKCVTWRMHLNWATIVPHFKGISWFCYYFSTANKQINTTVAVVVRL